MSLKNYSKSHIPTYPILQEIFQSHEKAHWLSSEVNLQPAIEQWKSGKITESEKTFIANILRLFTASDVNVAKNYVDILLPRIKNNEARNMLLSFAAREATHQISYALLTDTLGFEEEFYEQFLEYPEMSEKHEFMIEDIGDSTSDLGVFLAKESFLEGVCLFSSFAMLLNFNRNGKMSGAHEIFLWSTRDEDIHAQGLAKLFNILVHDHPEIVNDDFKGKIYSCATEVVRLEHDFIDLVFANGSPEGINCVDIKTYVEYMADRRLNHLGLKKIWHSENPIDWIDMMLGGTNHADFFGRDVTDYSKNNFTDDFDAGY